MFYLDPKAEDIVEKKDKEENKEEALPPREFTPYAIFGKSATIDKSHHKIIRGLRAWAKKNFVKF